MLTVHLRANLPGTLNFPKSFKTRLLIFTYKCVHLDRQCERRQNIPYAINIALFFVQHVLVFLTLLNHSCNPHALTPPNASCNGVFAYSDEPGTLV